MRAFVGTWLGPQGTSVHGCINTRVGTCVHACVYVYWSVVDAHGSNTMELAWHLG